MKEISKFRNLIFLSELDYNDTKLHNFEGKDWKEERKKFLKRIAEEKAAQQAIQRIKQKKFSKNITSKNKDFSYLTDE